MIHRLKDSILKYILTHVRGTINMLNLHIEVQYETQCHMLLILQLQRACW